MLLKAWDALPQNMKNAEVKVYYDMLKERKLSLIIKRIFDIVMALFLIVLLSPIILILAILIKLDSKGPIFYRQERITTCGKKFKIFKFRTMIVDADKSGALVTTKNDNRITKVGMKIRKYRLDEIPQLFNIFFGDMSFVGVRPEVKKYVDAYGNEMRATLLLPAGVTSLASIEFKDEDVIIQQLTNEGIKVDEGYINYILPKKMELNLIYLQEFNIIYDFKLCIKTVLSVLIK